MKRTVELRAAEGEADSKLFARDLAPPATSKFAECRSMITKRLLASMGAICNASMGFISLAMFVLALYGGEMIWAIYALSTALFCFGAET